MSSTGYIQVRAFASRARLPLKDAAITVTTVDGQALAMRLTDESGLIRPIPIAVPDTAAGQTPDTGETPYAAVTLYAYLDRYEAVTVRNLQVFPDVITCQDLELIPLAELPEGPNLSEDFDTPPQNL